MHEFTYQTTRCLLTFVNYYLGHCVNYEQLAQAENKEVNAKRNNSWKEAKVDGKKIWDLIDWNGKAEAKKQILIQDTEIYPYF